jgi:hypothetical protein
MTAIFVNLCAAAFWAISAVLWLFSASPPQVTLDIQ